MRQLLSQVLFLSFLLISSGCKNQLKLTSCNDDAAHSQLDCSNAKNVTSTVPMSDTQGYVGMPSYDSQAFLSYCGSRFQPGVIAPRFNYCVSDGNQWNCTLEVCSINSYSNGAICTPSNKSVVAFSDSDKYSALSQSDAETLFLFCNVEVQ